MTDDRMNKIREIMEICINEERDTRFPISPRDVLALLDMIDRLRAEAETNHEYTVEDLL